jgi:glycosyltransferase involved in cell wall biosynthesis
MDQLYLHGGAEKIVTLKLNALASRGFNEVSLITSQQGSKEFLYALNSKVKTVDLSIDYNRNKSFFHPLNILRSLLHFIKLRRKLRELGAEVIVSVSQTPDQFFLPFMLIKTRKIKEFHGSGYASKINPKLFRIYERYDSLVVLNKDEQQYYPFENVVVIPNFIEREIKTIWLPEKPRQKNIIAAGRIAEVKQFDHLIKAWSRIAHKHSDWKVAIYGDGDVDLLHRLNIEIKDLGLSNITLYGATADLAAIMQESSIFALTSSTECFPMVLLEAMSHGLPIVSYDCPHGPRNILDKYSGVLVAKNDVQKLAEALSYFMDNEEERKDIATAAMQKVKEYSEANVMGQWETLFANLIDFKKEIKHT